jgi:hypothetical protein
MNQLRKQKTEREAANEANGIRVDVEFQQMIEDHKLNVREMAPVILHLYNSVSILPPIKSKLMSASKRDPSSPMNLQLVSSFNLPSR